MRADCHIHMALDGVDWKNALNRHRIQPDETYVRRVLQMYREKGYTYLRDGGDRFGAGLLARHLAPRYGITYRTPDAPVYKTGHYGSFIGTAFENTKAFTKLIRKSKGDFVKIMISGLMDFHQFGVLTEEGLEKEEIKELIHIAHSEGFAVMVHANGQTALYAAEAGADSVEHGAYLTEEALFAMKEAGTVWVPTLSTVGNLRGTGRFQEDAVKAILQDTTKNVARFSQMGGLLALGTDAGAWAVPHGSQTEAPLLQRAGVTEAQLLAGIAVIKEKFRRTENE